MSAKCIFVDDDRNLLLAIERQLEANFNVTIFNSTDKALEFLGQEEPAVIVSDFRMPKISGLDFLREAKGKSPCSVLIMLTGLGDLKVAKEALNEIGVFRFMTKPCSALEITKNLADAVATYERIKSERELLKNTLSGVVQIFTDIMRAVDPIGFEEGRCLKQDVSELSKLTGISEVWEMGLASVLQNLGSLVIPTPILVKHRISESPSPADEQFWTRVPNVSADLIDHVPRLENIASLVRWQGVPSNDPKWQTAPKGAKLLRTLNELNHIKANRRLTEQDATSVIAAQHGWADPEILEVVKQYFHSKDNAYV